MRTFKLISNETCNHRCSFCHARRERERVAIASPTSIRTRLDQAQAEGCQEIVFTGGEPTLRRDLVRIIAYAQKLGFAALTLETNGSTLDAPSITALVAAGLSTVRIHCPAWGDAADAITGVPGSHEQALRAITLCDQAGLAVEVSIPLVAANVTLAAEIPRHLHDDKLPVARIVAVVPTTTPQPRDCLETSAACAVVEKLAATCRSLGQTLQLASEPPIPPCAFDHPSRVAHLFALTPGGRERPGHTHVAGCSECRVFDRCPGPGAALRASGFSARPIKADRIRRRLSIIASVEQQIARELVTPELYQRHDGVLVRGTTIRVNFNCNQACHFCFVSTHLPAAKESRIREAIVEAARGGGHVILSGGEPTLNPKLEDYIALAHASGASRVEIQTNAIGLADATRTESLVAAGLSRAFVSLHGATVETSDAVTAAPGTHVKTLAGIDVLAKLSVTTELNFVFCRRNHHEFPDYVRMVATRWPEASICVSFVGASTDMVPHTTDLIPRYRDILPDLARGLALANQLGVDVAGFDSMCGIPLCLVPGELVKQYNLAEIPAGFDDGEFLRAPACDACAWSRQCFGVRRRYADLYGIDELHPLPPATPDACEPA